MANFEIIEEQGTHYVRATLHKEAIRAEAGALCKLEGDIRIEAPLPSPLAMMRSAMSDETMFRPRYVGTGVVDLESSLGGFYALDLRDESWILDRGAYWASEDSVTLSVYRERVWTSLWVGAGVVDYRTRVSGTGRVVLATRGPVEEVTLDDSRCWVQGPYVIARTAGVSYRIRRPTKSFWRSFTTRERLLRGYEGTGRLLVTSVPYWRLMVAEGRGLTGSPPSEGSDA
jgi:uncharacterized protein (AIM24 family)